MRPARQLETPTSPLAALLQSFAGRLVLVIGDLVADHYIYGETDRISREAPVLIVRYESSEVQLGGAGNAAANLRDLGARVTALGWIGRDEMGRRMRELARKTGIKMVSPRSGKVPTETKTRILAGGLNTRRQQMLRLDHGTRGVLPAEMQAELAGMARELMKETEAVLVSDYGAGVLGEPVIAEVLSAAKAGVPVVVDSRYNLRAFAGATVIKPNEPEFEAFAGIRAEDEDGLRRALKTAIKRLPGTRALVVTRGRNGMIVCEGGRIERIDAHGTKPAVDVTGAGDTVGSTLTLALAAGANYVEAARLANIAGALKVQKPGTVTVSAQELARELESLP
jgi:rfaE bifunctional protein kinase chain/domain